MNHYFQKPTNQSNWLFKDIQEGDRIFAKSATIPIGQPKWAECTDAEKQAWKEAHKPEESQQAEEQATE